MLAPVLEIVRLEETEDGTLGILKINKGIVACTLEPPDRENEQNRSSIPAQQYRLRRIESPTFGETFQVQDVPGRTAIVFHPGNTVEDTEGCIIVGSTFGSLRGRRAVLQSGTAFVEVMQKLAGYSVAHLTIHEHY